MAQLNPRSAPHVRPKWTHGASATSSGEESSSARRCCVPGLNAFPRLRGCVIAFLLEFVIREYRLDPQKEIITERQFVDIFKKVYPDVRLYGLDDEEGNDIWASAVGYWDANRILFSRADEEVRMWRNYGRWDYRFKSAKEFEDWLEIAHSHERKFEEIVKV